MRKDLHKKIVERGRRNYGSCLNGYRRARLPRRSFNQYDAFDFNFGDAPKLEPMRRGHHYKFCGKLETDTLSVLERWLNKQIGRAWDDVYSDLSFYYNKRTVRGFHLHQHVKIYVEHAHSNYDTSITTVLVGPFWRFKVVNGVLQAPGA